jgi:predicted SAM-dependent methyltransferase
MRIIARIKTIARPSWRGCDRLHFGCGRRKVSGWLNVDLTSSDCDIDLAHTLPWASGTFSQIVSQQTIEHLELVHELLPLLKELRRVARPGAELWLSCPDMEKICMAYGADHGRALLEDRKARRGFSLPEGMPPQQIINVLFHQDGEHKNIYDYNLLTWALMSSGFNNIMRRSEREFMLRFPEFPSRGDDFHSLYVSCVAG